MKKLGEEEKNVLKLARAFSVMLKSEGWHYFKQILEARRTAHTNAVMSSTNDIAGVLAGERDKGAVVALGFVLNLPEITCSQAEEIRKASGEDPDGD